MAKETTNAGKMGSLGRLDTALEANAAELPHLEGPRLRLKQIVIDGREVEKQQAAFIASKQEASKRLKTLLIEGERIANGLRKFLIEHYGLRSEKLAEFGLQPFRGRPRKAKPENPEPPENPNPSPAAPDAGPAEPVNPKL